MPGSLYIVATPIGNLADITLRALETLRSVDLIAAEDTRHTRHLLSHFGITVPMTPYHQHSTGRKIETILDELKSGKNIAIVSDAGTPGISDPGHEIIALCIENDIPIINIPGPNAVIFSMVVSGLSTRRFAFDGFPPRRPSERRAFFRELQSEIRTMVFYESPLRLLSCLKDMQTVWGDRKIAVVREATKMFEEVHRGTVSSAIERFSAVPAKGEITIVVEGGSEVREEASEDEIESALREALASGTTERDAVKQIAEVYSVPKKEVYRRMLDLKKGGLEDEE